MNMSKKLWYESTETTVKNKKGFIEIDTDFTQVYDCFSKLSVKVKSVVTLKLLFWLLSHEANKSNGVSSGSAIFDKFKKYLINEGVEPVALRTFKAAFEELTKIGALTRVGRGHYYLNPYVFWRDDKTERMNFITDEKKDKKFISHNPYPDTKKLKQ